MRIQEFPLYVYEKYECGFELEVRFCLFLLLISVIILIILDRRALIVVYCKYEEEEYDSSFPHRTSFGTSLLLSSRVRPLNIPSVDLTRSKRCDDGDLICQQPHTSLILRHDSNGLDTLCQYHARTVKQN